jgi:hypothetical protein
MFLIGEGEVEGGGIWAERPLGRKLSPVGGPNHQLGSPLNAKGDEGEGGGAPLGHLCMPLLSSGGIFSHMKKAEARHPGVFFFFFCLFNHLSIRTVQACFTVALKY